MSQLGRFEDSFASKDTGLPIVGAEVTLYREGATADGDSGPNSPTLVVTVHSPGRIVNGDSVFLDNDPSTTYSVTGVTATTVTLGGLGSDLTVKNLQRLVPKNSPPTLYEDDQGGGSGSTPNPLQTDSNGRVNCWMETGAYEEIIDVGGVLTLYKGIQVGYDAPAVIYSSVFDSATAVAHPFNTRNALATAGAKLLELYNNDVLKFSIDKDGKIVNGLEILTGDLDLTVGDLNVPAGDLNLTAGQIIMGAAASQLVPGVTSMSLRNNADNADNVLIDDDGNVTIRGNLDAGGGMRQLYGPFHVSNPAGTSSGAMTIAAPGGDPISDCAPVRAGSVVGISCFAKSTVTAGTMVLTFRKSGLAGTMSVQMDSGNSKVFQATQTRDIDVVGLNDWLGVNWASTGLLPATTNDFLVFLEIES